MVQEKRKQADCVDNGNGEGETQGVTELFRRHGKLGMPAQPESSVQKHAFQAAEPQK